MSKVTEFPLFEFAGFAALPCLGNAGETNQKLIYMATNILVLPHKTDSVKYVHLEADTHPYL